MILAGALSLASVAAAQTSDAPWTGGGSGTTNVVSDGSAGPAVFTYAHNGPYSGSWEFSTTAASTGSHTLTWDYSGFHSWYQVTVELEAFVDDGTTVSTASLVNAGPADCCTSPSGGYAYSGSHTFQVQAGDVYGFRLSGSHFDTAEKLEGTLRVDEPNLAPVCSDAAASQVSLWPPNHEYRLVDVVGVDDAENDVLAIAIDSIFQDEAVDAPGSGDTSPGATGVGGSSAQVRSERTGGGNGRVYHIAFTASDAGGSCSGVVRVGVPHDRNGDPAVDDGPSFDSTIVP